MYAIGKTENGEEIRFNVDERLCLTIDPKQYLDSIDFSNCKAVKELWISCIGLLASLDLSDCIDLERLECSGNELRELNISNCKNLKILNCTHNQLKSLNISNNKKLNTLQMSENNITEIDITNCKKLKGWNEKRWTGLYCDRKVEIIGEEQL